MIFTKYRDHGDYHWRQYAAGGRYYRHIEKLAAWITEWPLLDIGGGDGCLAGRVGAVVVDTNPEGLRLAHSHGVMGVIGDAHALPFRHRQFGAALLIDVLEHVADPGRVLEEARRVAAVVYLATPPARPDGRLHDRFHLREWTPSGLATLLVNHGWQLASPIELGHKVMYARAIA